MHTIENYVKNLLARFASMDQREILDGEHLDEYFDDNLLFLTIHLKVGNSSLKDDRLIEYAISFRRYYYYLCKHMFDGEIRKNKSRQPLAIGFYDQEGTRQRLNYKVEQVPHIHCLLLFKSNTVDKFRSCFTEKNNYELTEIKKACFLNTNSDSPIENLISYCTKYSNIKRENVFSPFFEILPDFLEYGRNL